ncbi:MAG: hypothetical protein ACTSYO_01745 [Candidatus Ranarchaeia archaeon]
MPLSTSNVKAVKKALLFFVITGFLAPISGFTFTYNTIRKDQSTPYTAIQAPKLSVSSETYSPLFGFYMTPDSDFATSESQVFRYSLMGPLIETFNDLTSDIERYRIVVVPIHNWSSQEIDAVTDFMEQGGTAFICGPVPSSLVNVSLDTIETAYVALASSYCPADFVNGFWFSYKHAFRTLFYNGFANIPLEVVRPVYVINQSYENDASTVAKIYEDRNQLETGYIGDAIIKIPRIHGQLYYSSISIFDFLGQIAAQPFAPERGSTLAGREGRDVVSLLLATIALEQQYTPILRWMLPGLHLYQIWPRDDVDTYYSEAVAVRSEIERAEGIKSVFHELSDDINDGWGFLRGFHYAGYHRDSTKEKTGDSILRRLNDIEAETGAPCYFTSHHGGGLSGYTGRGYILSLNYAAEKLGHYLVYDSAEGNPGGGVFLYPYIIRNGSSMYVSEYLFNWMKYTTIDFGVFSGGIDDLLGWLARQQRLYRPIHYLLHTQNVRSYLANYNGFLSAVNKTPWILKDPLKASQYNILAGKSVRILQSSSMNKFRVIVSNDIADYTFFIPLRPNTPISAIRFDDHPVPKVLLVNNFGNFSGLLFSVDLTSGNHTLSITKLAASDDYDNDGISDTPEFCLIDPNEELGYDISAQDITNANQALTISLPKTDFQEQPTSVNLTMISSSNTVKTFPLEFNVSTQSYQGQYTFCALDDEGKWDLYVSYASDPSYIKSIYLTSIRVDYSPPTINYLRQNFDRWLSTSTSPLFNITDSGSSVTTVKWRTGSGPWNPCVPTATGLWKVIFSSLGKESHVFLTVMATDQFNRSRYWFNFFQVDTDPPQVILFPVTAVTNQLWHPDAVSTHVSKSYDILSCPDIKASTGLRLALLHASIFEAQSGLYTTEFYWRTDSSCAWRSAAINDTRGAIRILLILPENDPGFEFYFKVSDYAGNIRQTSVTHVSFHDMDQQLAIRKLLLMIILSSLAIMVVNMVIKGKTWKGYLKSSLTGLNKSITSAPSSETTDAP